MIATPASHRDPVAMPAPVAVFAFNRPAHLARVLAALAGNDLAAATDVTIFCDGVRGPRDLEACGQVRDVAHAAEGFRRLEVVPREENLGCARSVILGTEQMFGLHKRLVVIEDDVVAGPHALRFLNAALEHYAESPNVFSIAAWAPPRRLLRLPPDYPFGSYFFRRFHCWGWASWRDRWVRNDWTVPGYETYRRCRSLRAAHAEGGADLPGMLDAQMESRIDSWAIRAEYTRFRSGGVTLYPRTSFVRNIGIDGTGTHCGSSDPFQGNDGLSEPTGRECFPSAAYVDPRIARAFRRVYNRGRVLNGLRRLLVGGWKAKS